MWAAETLLKNAGSLMMVMVSTALAVLFLIPPPACANIVMSTCSCQTNHQTIIIYESLILLSAVQNWNALPVSRRMMSSSNLNRSIAPKSYIVKCSTFKLQPRILQDHIPNQQCGLRWWGHDCWLFCFFFLFSVSYTVPRAIGRNARVKGRLSTPFSCTCRGFTQVEYTTSRY